ncbi:hypothetical protein E2C01_039927 [Portunus trituberculatus]|uniref:Uncharacterized protein n=1 Tax=Portunus trituberculatus TaxID=210409 RepID=A0A5B7FM77_PORTR|nr:hypothetical protein [Portunus trituberculatus]
MVRKTHWWSSPPARWLRGGSPWLTHTGDDHTRFLLQSSVVNHPFLILFASLAPPYRPPCLLLTLCIVLSRASVTVTVAHPSLPPCLATADRLHMTSRLHLSLFLAEENMPVSLNSHFPEESCHSKVTYKMTRF